MLTYPEICLLTLQFPLISYGQQNGPVLSYFSQTEKYTSSNCLSLSNLTFTLAACARTGKSNRYTSLVFYLRLSSYYTRFFSLEVGSRGFISNSNFLLSFPTPAMHPTLQSLGLDNFAPTFHVLLVSVLTLSSVPTLNLPGSVRLRSLLHPLYPNFFGDKTL